MRARVRAHARTCARAQDMSNDSSGSTASRHEGGDGAAAVAEGPEQADEPEKAGGLEQSSGPEFAEVPGDAARGEPPDPGIKPMGV